MKSLVHELQKQAMDPNVRIADLLRTAQVVAQKLGVTEFGKWITNEQKGYIGEPTDRIPEYRKTRGYLKTLNPFHGWQPVVISDPDMESMLTAHDVREPISSLEEIARHAKTEIDTLLSIPMSSNTLSVLGLSNHRIELHMPPSVVFSVLDAVRNTVLNWSLRLEKDGILGEGVNFSREERTKAEKSVYNINSFHGVIGDVSGGAIQVGDNASLAQQISELNLPENEIAEIRAILSKLKVSDASKSEIASIKNQGVVWLSRNWDKIGALSIEIAKVIFG